jgi:hypothetical protein
MKKPRSTPSKPERPLTPPEESDQQCTRKTIVISTLIIATLYAVLTIGRHTDDKPPQKKKEPERIKQISK